MIVSLGFAPRRWQSECLEAIKDSLRSVLLVHRRAGKTELAIALLIDRALRFREKTGRRDGRFAYIAPLLKQARETAWDRLKRYAGNIPGAVTHEQDLSVTLPGGSKITLYGADAPDSLRGIYLDGAVLDELAQMKRDAWEVVISTALIDRNGWALFIGTVKGITLLSELYRKHLKEKTEGWYVRKLTWRDTGALTDGQIALARATMTEAQFRQEMENDETAATFESLIPMDLILAQSGKNLRLEAYDFAARVIGVDVAYSHTGDRCVIFKRQGLASFNPWISRGVNNMDLAAEVARQYDEWQADAMFIDSGRGEGVISRLRQLGYNPIAVEFGGKAGSAHFANKKAEILYAIKEWLEQGGVLPDLPELQVDLGVLQMDRSDRTDRLAVTVDDTMPSPDTACALACTFAAPVRPKTRTELERFESQARQSKQDSGYGQRFWERAEGKR